MIDWFTGKVAYQITRLGFTVGSSLAKSFPRGVYWLSDRLAVAGFYCFRGFRQKSISNLQVAFGDGMERSEVSRIARQSLRSFFRACVEIAALIDASDEEISAKIVVDGREHLQAALEKGNGVLLLSAHLGNFFLLGTRLAVEGFPTYVLVNQPRDGQFAQLMDEYRLQIRQKTIHARPRQEALNQLNAVFRRNQIAVVIADEYRKGSGVQVALMGRTVIARRGPATLALRTGAAVVPAYVIRQGEETLRLIIEPELELVRSGKGKAEIEENTIRMTDWLERTIRKYPDQWNWSNIRWWASAHQVSTAEPQHLKQAS
jgi:Kdo2-lipid IVA lauroyltransferase/acyltransferase